MNKVHFTPGRVVNVCDRMQVQGEYGLEAKTEGNTGVLHSLGLEGGNTIALVEIDRGGQLRIESFPFNDVWLDNKEGK